MSARLRSRADEAQDLEERATLMAQARLIVRRQASNHVAAVTHAVLEGRIDDLPLDRLVAFISS